MVVSIEPEGQRFFQSSVTLKTYPLPDTKVNCSSSNLIYLISCSACGKQYMGKSFTSLKVHHDKHRTQIRHKSEGVGKHFSSCGYECLKLQIIEVCNENDNLQDREGFWMDELRTVAPAGINLRKEKNKKLDPLKEKCLLEVL